MSANQEPCPLCQKELGSEDEVKIGKKGAEGINNASVERGNNITVTDGTTVHKSCRSTYINKKYIEKDKKSKFDSTSSVKRSARLSIGPFDSKTDCLFCGEKVVTSKVNVYYENYSCVRTYNFVENILVVCL